jgi:hypothetical protein
VLQRWFVEGLTGAAGDYASDDRFDKAVLEHEHEQAWTNAIKALR